MPRPVVPTPETSQEASEPILSLLSNWARWRMQQVPRVDDPLSMIPIMPGGMGGVLRYRKAVPGPAFPPLSGMEALWKSSREGSPSAQAGLLQELDRFLSSMSNKYLGKISTRVRAGGHIDYPRTLADLMQESRMAALRASESFDPAAGSKFKTHVAREVKSGLSKYVREMGGPMSTEKDPFYLMQRMERIRQEYLAKHGKEPSVYTLARRLNVTPEELELGKRTRSMGRGTGRETPLRARSEERSLPLEAAPPEDLVTSLGRFRRSPESGRLVPVPEFGPGNIQERVNLLRRAMNELPDRERSVLEMLSGLVTGEPMSETQIGKELGVDQSTVHRIIRRAGDRLKKLYPELAGE